MSRPVHWNGGVRTVGDLQRINRQRARRRIGGAKVLAEMERGANLHLHYANSRALWSLSTGAFVTAEVAALVIARPEVVAVGDSLFRNIPGQTWRCAEEELP